MPNDLTKSARLKNKYTPLLVPLIALTALARQVITPDTPYVELRYRQALALSTTYQAGIVVWVGFWALYGQGFTAAKIAASGISVRLSGKFHGTITPTTPSGCGSTRLRARP